MNYLKRSVISVRRRVIKSILLLIILFIVGNSIAGAVAVRLATDNLETVIKNQLGAIVKVDFNANDLIEESEKNPSILDNIEYIDTDLLLRLGNSEYVKNFDFTTSVSIGASTYQLWNPPGIVISEQEKLFGIEMLGTNNPEILLIQEGRAKLVSGRTFSKQEIDRGESVSVVMKQLADLNEWSVGDEIVLKNNGAPYFVLSGNISKSKDVLLKIIGIIDYTAPSWELPMQMTGSVDDERKHYNQILVPNKIVQNEQRHMWELSASLRENQTRGEIPQFNSPFNAYFALNSPDDIQTFITDNQPLLPKFYKLTASNSVFSKIEASIDQAKSLSLYILTFTIGASLLIIGLVLLLFLLDRKHELGIYMALGESRSNIIKQIVIEVLLIAILAIGLSLITGNQVAKVLSDSMIRDHLSIDTNYTQDQSFWTYKSQFGKFMSFASSDDILQAYKIKFSPFFVLLFTTTGIITVVLSTLVPVIHILRFNPKKHLM